jgi:hypothetical protein
MTDALRMKRELNNLHLSESILELLPLTDIFGLKGNSSRGVALYRKCAVVRWIRYECVSKLISAFLCIASALLY